MHGVQPAAHNMPQRTACDVPVAQLKSLMRKIDYVEVGGVERPMYLWT